VRARRPTLFAGREGSPCPFRACHQAGVATWPFWTVGGAVRAASPLLFPGGRRSWETLELTSLGRLPPRATLAREAAWTRSLDGAWEFRLVDRPEDALRAARRWDTVEVPGLWTMQGYDIPIYTN